MTDVAAPMRPSLLDYARRAPGTCLAVVLVLHVVIWTALPALLSHNLQLDLVEDLALGREWQLGYWKHPPLPWWLADLVYRLTGDVHAVYILGPLSAAVCMYVVWLLGRDIVGGFQSLIAVLALEGIHFFNFSVPKFAHDQMQLPFWAMTGLFLYRALANGRAKHWLLAGASLALCFWSKYAAFALAGSIGLFMLFDPKARASLRTPGPWLMALAFLVVIAPNVNWLIETGFMPMRYVDARAKIATQWYHVFTYPLQWTASQLFFIAPAIGLIALALLGARPQTAPVDETMSFARRYLAMLALGPFLVTTARRAPCRPPARRDVGLSALVVRAARRDRLVRAGNRQRTGAALRGGFPHRVPRDAARLRGGRGARTRLARPAQGDTISRPAVGR